MNRFTQSICCAMSGGVFGVAAATTNYLDTAMKLRGEEYTRYIRSLPEEAVWQMASEAYARGMNEHGIAVGIVGVAFDWEKHPPTRQKLLDLIQNQALHPGLRSAIAVSGLGLFEEKWTLEELLDYLDIVLDLFQSPNIPFSTKWKIPDALARAIAKKMDVFLARGNDESAVRALDALHQRAITALSYQTKVLLELRDLKEDPHGISYGGISDFLRIYQYRSFPTTQASVRAHDAVKAARRAVVRALRSPHFPSEMARLILREANEIRLEEALTEEDIVALKSDPRFADKEGQSLVAHWEQRVQQARKGAKPK